MKPKQQKDLEKAVGAILKYKPTEPPKKPEKAPPKAELERKWKLNV
jgi:hypothetical protein